MQLPFPERKKARPEYIPYTKQENCVIFTLIYTPILILHCALSLRVTIWKINPDDKISFSLTKSIFQSLFADKFAIKIKKKHEKSGNDFVFITAKNERLL